MNQPAEIEFSINRQERDSYSVNFRFTDNNISSQADVHLGSRQLALISFNFKQLNELLLMGKLKEYGQELTTSFFSSESLRIAFAQARAVAQQAGTCLRIRLAISANALELHQIKWELLNDPHNGLSMVTDQTLFFSRYLYSPDWHPIRLRSSGGLQALAIIAAPTGLEKAGLNEIDKPAEVSLITSSLKGNRLQILEHATIDNLISALTNQEFDLLYLVAHGTFKDGEGYLWLDNEEGGIKHVSGTDLVTRLQELEHRPRLVILISCQSAGKATGEVLSALGPRLAEMGIPAVLAMQGNLLVNTATKFLPIFFAEMQKNGQVDRAVTVARGFIRDQPDWWVPSLFMRLKNGRIWYTPGFSDVNIEKEKFTAQVRIIKHKKCTPIIGPGLVEPLLGSHHDIAQRWADEFNYPMAPHEREALPRVAQFLSTNQGALFPFDELEESIKRHIYTRYANELAEAKLSKTSTLQQMISKVGAVRRKMNELEPHRLLASFSLPIYVTLNQDRLMEEALSEFGRDVQTFICPWNEYLTQIKTIYDFEPKYIPTEERPLVIHLFGIWDQPESVVLTEDHYFDFLTGVTSNKELIPGLVREALAATGLLLLGFQAEDWSFRVILRSLLIQQGSMRRNSYSHIAAQLEPEDGRILEPARAKRYLERYFSSSADINIYWGNPEEFMAELKKYWDQ